MDKQLRLIAGQIVVESKLSKQAKLQMINFIQKEATDTQVKVLLMDGNIVQLDEQAEQIVNDRFEVSETAIKIESAIKTAGSVATWGLLWAAYRAIRGQFDICTKKCGTYKINTTKRQFCMAKCNVKKYEERLKAARKAGNSEKAEMAKMQLQKSKLKLQQAKLDLRIL